MGFRFSMLTEQKTSELITMKTCLMGIYAFPYLDHVHFLKIMFYSLQGPGISKFITISKYEIFLKRIMISPFEEIMNEQFAGRRLLRDVLLFARHVPIDRANYKRTAFGICFRYRLNIDNGCRISRTSELLGRTLRSAIADFDETSIIHQSGINRRFVNLLAQAQFVYYTVRDRC